MAHFAQIDENNIVITVVVVNNSDILDEHGIENEQVGINFLQKLFGKDTKWVQTSYNHKFRGRYAGIGYIYDEALDKFVTSIPQGNNSSSGYSGT